MNRLLVLGSSSVTYRLDGLSTADLVSSELNARDPEPGWSVSVRPVSMGRSMAEQTGADATEVGPDALILSLPAQPFVYEDVLVRIRRRWPRAHAYAAYIERQLKRLAASNGAGADSARSLLYSLPQRLALALIGGEPALSVENAIQNTTAALEALARFEDLNLIVRLPVGTARAAPARRRRYDERLATFKQAIEEACARRHIPCIDVGLALVRAGGLPAHAVDGVHLSLETRAFEARLLADALLAEKPRGHGAAVRTHHP